MTKISDKRSFEPFLNGHGQPLASANALDTAIQARRWAHLWFFRQCYPMPFVSQPEWYHAHLTYRKPSDLAPGRSPEFDRIMALSLDGQPCLIEPNDREMARSWEHERTITADLLEASAPEQGTFPSHEPGAWRDRRKGYLAKPPARAEQIEQ